MPVGSLADSFRELTFFLRVSEEASFSAAARSLDLDPSTISKVVQRLENRLGVRLFHRTSRVLRLTQEGERFLSAAQKVIQALDEAEESLNPARSEVIGVLRINCTAGFARFWLAPLMAAFVDRYPDLRTEFMLSASSLDLFENQLDVLFQSGSIPDSSLVVRRVTTVKWRIYGSPTYLERAGIPRTPDDLKQHRCLNFLPGSHLSHWPLRDGDGLRTIEPTGQVSSNNGDMLYAMAVAGLGLGRFAEVRVAGEEPSGGLVSVLDEYQPEGTPVYTVFPSRRHLSPRARAFLDHVCEHLPDD